MSELKATTVYDAYWKANSVGEGTGVLVYLKSEADEEIRKAKRALWLMTAEWAEGMGLASCNIAIKLSVKERFFYNDEANREKDIKKYRHRQVIFYKYADYCRKKAEEYK